MKEELLTYQSFLRESQYKVSNFKSLLGYQQVHMEFLKQHLRLNYVDKSMNQAPNSVVLSFSIFILN